MKIKVNNNSKINSNSKKVSCRFNLKYLLKKITNINTKVNSDYKYFEYLYEIFENILKGKKHYWYLKRRKLFYPDPRDNIILTRLLNIAHIVKMDEIERAIFTICATYTFATGQFPFFIPKRNLILIIEKLLNVDRFKIMERLIPDKEEKPYVKPLFTYKLIRGDIKEEMFHEHLIEDIIMDTVVSTSYEIFALDNIGYYSLLNEDTYNIFIKTIKKFEIDYKKKMSIQKAKRKSNNKKKNIISHKELYLYLKKYIIGQDEVLKIVSFSISNYFNMLNNNRIKDFAKNNIFFIGPTGSGKTYIIKKIADYIDIPVIIKDASEITQSGYVGKNIDSIEREIINKINDTENCLKNVIVYIDEIDKIAASKNDSIVTGISVQNELLTLLEGKSINKNSHISFDTSKVLFIVGGAFPELTDKKRSPENIGFLNNTSHKKKNKKTEIEMLRKYGFIDEFLGRFSLFLNFNSLNKNDLRNILLNTENSLIKQYKKQAEFYGIKLTFENSAIDFIVNEAYKLNTGARALSTIMASVITPLLYNAIESNRKRIKITRRVILDISLNR